MTKRKVIKPRFGVFVVERSRSSVLWKSYATRKRAERVLDSYERDLRRACIKITVTREVREIPEGVK